jgi:hypothetical protein
VRANGWLRDICLKAHQLNNLGTRNSVAARSHATPNEKYFLAHAACARALLFGWQYCE